MNQKTHLRKLSHDVLGLPYFGTKNRNIFERREPSLGSYSLTTYN